MFGRLYFHEFNCSLKIHIVRLFRARSSKTIECRFSLKCQKRPPDVFFKKRKPATLLKLRLWHKCFPVNFAKFLRTPFLQNTSGDCFYKSLKPNSHLCNFLCKRKCSFILLCLYKIILSKCGVM